MSSEITTMESNTSQAKSKSPNNGKKKKRSKKSSKKQDSSPSKINNSANHAEEFTTLQEVTHPELEKVNRVLPEWISNPSNFNADLISNTDQTNKVCPLLERKIHNLLKSNNINYFFPVQEAIIPVILEAHCGAELRWRPRDICVAAPTGSGKTLAYVLPIIQLLSKRKPTALRALVILPVAELAIQVYEVFKSYASHYNLKVGKDSDLSLFAGDQNLIIKQGQFEVDILIATPHRLLEHIIQNPDLKFDSLSFLVLDEADILMTGEFASIINRIQSHIFESQSQAYKVASSHFSKVPLAKQHMYKEKFKINKGNKFPSFSQLMEINKDNFSYFESKSPSGNLSAIESLSDIFDQVTFGPQKPTYGRLFAHRLLFSATLSHDPYLLQNLSLYHPKLYTSLSDDATQTPINKGKTTGYVVKPSGLKEEFAMVDENFKPLLLHHLLLQLKNSKGMIGTLVFANSIEVVHKLTILLKSLGKGKYVLREFTSGSHSSVRKMLVKKFIKGKIDVLFTTDALARGMDIPNLRAVISYDVPSPNTYIHRIGRTARAGKDGSAISIVTRATLKYLKHAVGDDFTSLTELKINEDDLIPYEESFTSALDTLTSKLKKNSRLDTGKSFKTLKRPKLVVKKGIPSSRPNR